MEQGNTVTTNGLSMIYNITPTKKDILQRLLEEKKITFDEMWVLAQEKESAPAPVIVWPSSSPNTYDPVPPWTITCSANKQTDDNK